VSGLPSAIATLYTGNQAGKSHLYGTGTGNRYKRVPHASLQQWQLADDVSSATLYMPKGGACSLLLFAADSPVTDDYRGEYTEFVNFSGSPWDVVLSNTESLEGGTWNNLPTSGLVVRTRESMETRLSVRGEWGDTFKNTIDTLLAGQDFKPVSVTRDGGPTFRWEPFPVGMSNLSPNAIYIKVRQALTIDIPGVPNYSAAVSYWVHLLLSGQAVTGHVDRWRVWVSAGFKNGEVKDVLATEAGNAIPTFNTLLTAWCASQPAPLKDVYFLPGTKVQGTLGGKKEVFKGFTDTDNDVTVVLSHPPQIPA
jgi:hypothetical protein